LLPKLKEKNVKGYFGEKWHPKGVRSGVLWLSEVVTNWYSFGLHLGYLKASKINLFGVY